MKDKDKTYEQLIKELASLRKRIAELEAMGRKRNQVEEALRQSEEKYRTILENIEEGYYEVDLAGNFTFFNDSMRSIQGYPRDELMGMNNRDYMDKDFAKKVYKIFNTVFRTGKSAKLHDWQIIRKDGSKADIEASVSLRRDASGNPTGFRGIVRDITERKRAEEVLREERDKAQQYLDIAEVILVALNKKGKITLINKKGNQILGYKEGELLGKDWFTTCVPSHIRKKIKNGFQKLMAGERTLTEFYENPALTKSGTERIMAWHNTLLKDAQGNPIGTLSSGEDITERKQAEEKLQESQGRYKTLFDEALVGICLADAKTGIIIDCNQELAALVGRERADLIGKPQNILHPPLRDNKTAFSPTFKQHLTDKEGQTLETQVVTKTGDIRDVEIKANRLDLQGRKVLQGLVHDITERKQAEEALRGSRHMLQTVLDSIPSAVFWKDRDSIYLGGNRTWLQAAGLKSSEEAVGKSDYDLPWEKKQADSFREDDRRVMEAGVPESGIIEPYLRADGTHAWAMTNKVPLRDTEGNVIGILGTFEDITERKQAEEELRESETRFRTLFEAIPDTVLVHDDKGTILHINEIGAQRLEYSAKNLIGRNLREIVTPENAASIADHVKETHKVGWSRFETRYVSRSGWKIMAEINEHPIMFGKKKAILSVARDITERKRAEEALQASEERFRQFFENEPTYCYMISPEGIIIDVNNAALSTLGYTKKELVDKPLKKIYAPECLPKMEQLLALWQKTGKLSGKEMVIITKKGERRMVLLSADTIKDANGKILYSISVQNDITERKQAEEALRESEEQYRELVENINDIIYATDATGIVTYIAPTIEPISGYTPSEIIGRPFYDFVYKEDIPYIQENFQKDISGHAEPREFRMVTKAGDVRWVRTSSQPFLQGRRVMGLRGVLTDITERKEAEEASLREKMFSDTVMNSSPGLLFVIDDKGDSMRWNKNVETVSGYSSQEISKMNVLDFVAKEDKKRTVQILQEALTKGHASLEINIITKLGKAIPFYITGVRTNIENTTCVVGAGVDISERKQTEEALKESEEKFRDLAEHSPNMIYINVKGRVVYTNEKCAELTGYTREEFYAPDFDFMTLIAPESIDVLKEAQNKHRQGKEVPPYEYTLISKEGRKIEAINATKLIQYGGEQALLGVVTDISERKEAEESLQHSYDQLRDTLISTVDALASTVEMKDQYIAGHQPRVTQLACAIAKEMGLTEEQIEGIHMAGTIHDIGKIMVPAEILNKPGPLTDIQHEMVKMHPRAGYDILKGIEFPWPVAQIVLQHHERMDGSGYPDGLSGEEIMLEARILAVANVIESMTSHRPYRPAFDLQEALEKISKNKGNLYDPAVVDVCLKLFTKKGFTFDSVKK